MEVEDPPQYHMLMNFLQKNTAQEHKDLIN